jgi:lambda repressor-like predicted transcriptional regulator
LHSLYKPQAVAADHTSIRFWLRLGLAFTILAIAIDPFSQQLLQLNQEPVIGYIDEWNYTEATSPRSILYAAGDVWIVNTTESEADPDGPPARTMAARPSLPMEAAILSGLSQPKDKIQQDVGVVCPTGNCTWDKFETLSVCSRCDDLTDKLERFDRFGNFYNYLGGFLTWDEEDRPYYPDNATAVALPNGHFLSNPNGCRASYSSIAQSSCQFRSPRDGYVTAKNYHMTAYGTGDSNRTASFQDLDTLIWSTSVIHHDDAERWRLQKEYQDTREGPYNGDEDVDEEKENPWNFWPNTPVRATECALYYCVKEIDERFEGNVPSEVSKEVDFVRTPESYQHKEDDPYLHWPENTPDSYGSLEFHERYSAASMTPLSLEYTNATGFTSSYNVTDVAVKAISSYFQDTLRQSWVNESEVIAEARKTIPYVREMWNANFSDTVVAPRAFHSIWDRGTGSAIEERFETLAISMSNDLRKTEPGTFDKDLFNLPYTAYDPVSGKMAVPVKVVSYEVAWYWIVLHGIVILGPVAFCAATIYHSRDVPIWKGHSLATMSERPATHFQALEDAFSTPCKPAGC